MKETEKIMEHFRFSMEASDLDELNEHVSKMLGLMAKILTMIEKEQQPNLPVDRNGTLRITGDFEPKKREKILLDSCYANLQQGLFAKNGSWIQTYITNSIEKLDSLSPNIYQFCEIVENLFLAKEYEFSRFSELIFNLLELEYDEEAQLIQEALNALEIKGSEYEFCGKIRSTLEKIIVRFIVLVNEPNRGSIFNNLHSLIKRKLIEKKFANVISSNYSYGSQFIHQERKFNLNEAKMFVDQMLLHTEKILSEIKEFKQKNNKEKKEEEKED